jgi:hypothetical protein
MVFIDGPTNLMGSNLNAQSATRRAEYMDVWSNGKIQEVFCNAISDRGAPGTYKTGIAVKIKS